MEDNKVQFEDFDYIRPARQNNRNVFIDFLINKGIAKDKKQAMYALVGVIGVCVLIIIWNFFIEPSQTFVDPVMYME